jgi:protein-S-isoprenylcysteine O-methyltransferase Ste14
VAFSSDGWRESFDAAHGGCGSAVSEDNPRVFVPPPLIFGGLLALGLIIDRGPASSTIQLLAVACGLTGLGLIGTALGVFRTNRTRPEPWQPASALVAGGIYRFTRNPMYLGMALVCLGVALHFASIPAAVLTLLAVLIIDRTVIRREEAYLLRRFGDDYRVYQSKVRRWL